MKLDKLILMIMVTTFIFGWVVVLDFQLVVDDNSYRDTQVDSIALTTQRVTGSQLYTPHASISITSDTQLNNSFPGTGTIDDPVRIEGYNITASSNPLIAISGTTFHFIIKNNILNGLSTASEGITISNVINGKIANNSITGILNGIVLSYSENNTVSDNIISNDLANFGGINLDNSDFNNITGNIIFEEQSHENNGQIGISLSASSNNTIHNNSVFNISFSAISVGEPGQVANNNNISQNLLYGRGYGIILNTDNNTIAKNVIHDNNGVSVTGNNNTFNSNDFKNAQVVDDGLSNVFSKNYWNDWSGTGSYQIAGTPGNQDTSPLANPFHISPVYAFSTMDNLTLAGNVIITWSASIDRFDHSLAYSVLYSANGGSSWTTLASSLTTTSYTLNTSIIADGTVILLKVQATDSAGFTTKTISNETFLIANTPHQLLAPVITSPSGGKLLNGTVNMKWSASSDLWAHQVTYSVYYAVNGSENWILLISGLAATSYSWDTTTVPNSSSYLIKVIVTCSAGLSAESITDDPFSIQNTSASLATTPGLSSGVFLIALAMLIGVRKSRKK